MMILEKSSQPTWGSSYEIFLTTSLLSITHYNIMTNLLPSSEYLAMFFNIRDAVIRMLLVTGPSLSPCKKRNKDEQLQYRQIHQPSSTLYSECQSTGVFI